MVGFDVSPGLDPGQEISYTEVTATVTVTFGTAVGTAINVLSPPTIVFDGGPVLVHFYCPQLITGASGSNCQLGIYEGAANLAMIGIGGFSRNDAFACFYRFTPTAGPHTYTIKAWNSGGTTNATLNCGAGGSGLDSAMFVRFTKA